MCNTNQNLNLLLPCGDVHTDSIAASEGGNWVVDRTLGAPSSFIGRVDLRSACGDFSVTVLPAATGPATAGMLPVVMVANYSLLFGPHATCTQHITTHPTRDVLLCTSPKSPANAPEPMLGWEGTPRTPCVNGEHSTAASASGPTHFLHGWRRRCTRQAGHTLSPLPSQGSDKSSTASCKVLCWRTASVSPEGGGKQLGYQLEYLQGCCWGPVVLAHPPARWTAYQYINGLSGCSSKA